MIQKLASATAVGSPNVAESVKHEFAGRWIDSVNELRTFERQWNSLAGSVERPNIFFDPCFLLPAMRHLNEPAAQILIVEAPLESDARRRAVCAVIPFVRRRFYGLPIRCYEIWRHEQCLDATPLIRDDCAKEILRYVFDKLGREQVGLLSLNTIAASGQFAEAMDAAIQEGGYPVFQRDRFSRAAIRPLDSAQAYLTTHVSKSVLKHMRRAERRLMALGELRIEQSQPQSDYAALTRQFLELEASGWKGKAGSALACQPETRGFFEEMVSRAAEMQQISFVSLLLDDRPLAILCDLNRGGYGWAYKTAFDESFGRYSPGLLAEVKNITRLHQSGLSQVDSCTDPDNQTINRIWGQRLEFQSLVVGLGDWRSRLAVQAMPLMQKAAKLAKKWIRK